MTPDPHPEGGRTKTGVFELYRTLKSLATAAREVLSTEAEFRPVGPAPRNDLVAEVPDACEHHGQTVFVGGRDHFLVTDRATGLGDRRSASLGRQGRAVREWEQSLRDQHRACQGDLYAGGFFTCGVDRIDARGRAAAHRERAVLGNECD